MSDRIHELLNRNLQEVFGEGDAARRRSAIEALYTNDCVLYRPRTRRPRKPEIGGVGQSAVMRTFGSIA